MFRKSILSLFVIFGIAFPLMAAQDPDKTNDKTHLLLINREIEHRTNLINREIEHQTNLNRQDQYIKYAALSIPIMVTLAATIKGVMGTLGEDGSYFSFLAGLVSLSLYKYIFDGISNVQEKRNNKSDELRKMLENQNNCIT